MIYLASWILTVIVLKFNFKIKVFGKENVPSKGALIYVSNHESYLDPLLLGISLPFYKWFYFIAKKDLFDKQLKRWYLKKIHALPLDREGDVSTVKSVIKMLKSGKSFILFPEGTRSKGKDIKQAKPGVGFITAKSGVSVLPAYIEGAYEAMPEGSDTAAKGSRINVFIGRPLKFENIDHGGKEAYQKISDEIMRNIAKLKEEHAGKVS